MLSLRHIKHKPCTAVSPAFLSLALSVPPLRRPRPPAQLASLLSAELGLALPPTLAFDYPTVSELAAILTAAPEVRPGIAVLGFWVFRSGFRI